MGTRDQRIDSYIEKSADFARPILTHLREVVHGACPEVEETVKWGMPHFQYKGMLCAMASFKAHCTFGFWKGRLIVDRGGENAEAAMGQFGRITSVAELPPKRVLAGFVKEAMRLNDERVSAPRRAPSKTKRPAAAVPDDLAAALRRNRKAAATFDAFSASHRREYIEWITEAKREETRERRVATAVEWLAEGKARNWKYERS
jgi:uncharacterized protein YdeI (YjbR/CyaY-like superfamily)